LIEKFQAGSFAQRLYRKIAYTREYMSAERHIVSLQNKTTNGEEYDGNIHATPMDPHSHHVAMFRKLHNMAHHKSKTLFSYNGHRGKTALDNT